MLEALPFLEPVLQVLAPQFLVILNAVLPIMLGKFAELEGPVSGAMVEASLFVKLSAFMVIQTFFVTALSGAVMKELGKLVEDPLSIIELLAKSLPAQATFFMQLSVVMSVSFARWRIRSVATTKSNSFFFAEKVTTFSIEGLRVAPLAIAFVRRCIGPNLTEKERNTTFMGLAPLNEPPEFPHADFLSNIVLSFVVFLVYATIAPLVSFILALCFIIMGTLFRHHFVYVYNAQPDSGGALYLNFIKILMSCLLIGEITVSGLLTLKKSAVATLMLPLIISTVRI